MRDLRTLGLRLAIFVCCTLSLQPAFALRSFYKRAYVITRVLDARTFDIARLGRVRLLGVAPAPHLPFGDQAWREAGAYCQANLVGKKVKLETDLQKSTMDGERLVYLYLEDGTLFNLELIRAGYATAESNALRQLRRLRAAEEEARHNRRGVWSEGEVFETGGLSSILSTFQRRAAVPSTAPASPVDRQSERKSALQALESARPAARTAPPSTRNPPPPTVDKPAAESNPTPASAASAGTPQGIYPGARLFIEDMDKDLDSFIRAEIVKKKIRLVVVVDPEEADLVMTASASGIMIFSQADKVMLWASEAGGRSLWWVGLKREGPRKVAERVIKNLKKAIETPD